MPDPALHEALIEAIDRFIDLCHQHKGSYALMGGVALQVWARQRATRDVDITVSLGQVPEEAWLIAVKRAGFLLERRETHGSARWCRFRFTPRQFPLDVQLDVFLATTPYQYEALQRAVGLSIFGRTWRVMRAEDLVLQKLVSNRPLDRADILALFEEQGGKLDRVYLKRWAKALGVGRRLASLLDCTASRRQSP